jgi:hypothetical protein
MRRSVESLFNPDGSLAKTKPIDTRVNAANLEYGAPDSFNDAVELSAAIANGNKARACFARYVFEFQRSRSIASADNCAMADIEKMVGSTSSILETLIKSLANDDIFWKGI